MKLLFVNCCISQRGNRSRTMALCKAFLDGYRKGHPQDDIIEEDIRQQEIPCFNRPMLDRRDALFAQKKFNHPMYAFARRFADADKIAIGAPLWDLLFPARLRAYAEHIAANGICYHYDAEGCHGDCRCSHLAYLTSSGSFAQEPCAPVLFWKQLGEMFGIARFDYIFAGGVDISPELERSEMAKAIAKAKTLGKFF